MACKHCSMRDVRYGRTTVLEGEPFTDEDFGSNAKATIQHDRDFGHLLFVEHVDEWNDEIQCAVIPIRNCPWCGDELKEVR